jgi:hypothetical protein
MSFVWVQQWFALPFQMGDLPPDSRSHTVDFTAAGLACDSQHAPPASSSPHKAQDNNTPFYSQLSSISQGQHRSDHRSSAQNQYLSQHESSPFKMGAMAGALPDYASDLQSQTSQSIPRSLSGASTSAVVYQLGQSLQMPAHVAGNMPNYPTYSSGYGASLYQQGYMPQQAIQGGIYPTYNPNQSRMQGVAPLQNPYQSYQQPSQYMYYPAPFGAQGQYPGGYQAQGTQGQPMYGRRPSLGTAPLAIPGQNMEMPPHEGSFAPARFMSGETNASTAAFSAPFYQGPGLFQHHHSPYSETDVLRNSSIYFYQFHPSWPTSQAKAIGSRSLGGEFASGHDSDINERPLLSRCH